MPLQAHQLHLAKDLDNKDNPTLELQSEYESTCTLYLLGCRRGHDTHELS